MDVSFHRAAGEASSNALGDVAYPVNQTMGAHEPSRRPLLRF